MATIQEETTGTPDEPRQQPFPNTTSPFPDPAPPPFRPKGPTRPPPSFPNPTSQFSDPATPPSHPRGPIRPPTSRPSLPAPSSSSQSTYFPTSQRSAQQPYHTFQSLLRRPYSTFHLPTQQYIPSTRQFSLTFQPFHQRSLPPFQSLIQRPFPTFPPPTQQSFPQSQVLRNRRVHNQTQDPQSYSQCTGNKKALIIGINYADHPRLRLSRGISDAYDMARFLRESERFQGADIRVLVDRRPQLGPKQQSNDPILPSRENILEAMQWLVREARQDDSLFFYFSGHIKQFKGVDGNDIGICAMDYRDGRTGLFRSEEASGMISHEMMRDILIDPLPPGCRLTAIFDSLNSGNFLNLPYVYSPYGVLEDSSVKHRDMQDDIAKVADVISLGTCGGAEPPDGSSSGGSLGAAYMRALEKRVTYGGLIQDLRNRMEVHSRQRPQLSSLHEIDTRFEFIV